MNSTYLTKLLSDAYSNKYIWGGVRWDELTIERMSNPNALENFGYKVYSQNDEDGIIDEIFKRIGTTNKIFIEFGVQDGLESNTHYLIHKDWKGLWIEYDNDFYENICRKFVNVIREGQLKVLKEFITKDNINDIFLKAGIKGEIDLLSIDIDGNDYYVFENINVVNPRVIITEYNGKFPPDYSWKQSYNEFHIWDGSDKHGVSLKAFEELADKRGYSLVGTNINGCNAFFVRKDLVNNMFLGPFTSEYMYNPMRVNLKHVSGHPSKNCLYKMREGIKGCFDFLPDDQMIYFAYGFSDVEKSGNKTYRFINSDDAMIYYRGRELSENNDESISIQYINPFGDRGFILRIMENGNIVFDSPIIGYEGVINIDKNRLAGVDGGYVLNMKLNKLIVPAEVNPNSDDRRSLGIAVVICR